nr:hypothetical protein [uncultured Campylobacter sp.]
MIAVLFASFCGIDQGKYLVLKSFLTPVVLKNGFKRGVICEFSDTNKDLIL